MISFDSLPIWRCELATVLIEFRVSSAEMCSTGFTLYLGFQRLQYLIC